MYDSGGQLYQPPRTLGDIERGRATGLAITVAACSALAAGFVFLPWVSLGDPYGTTAVSFTGLKYAPNSCFITCSDETVAPFGVMMLIAALAGVAISLVYVANKQPTAAQLLWMPPAAVLATTIADEIAHWADLSSKSTTDESIGVGVGFVLALTAALIALVTSLMGTAAARRAEAFGPPGPLYPAPYPYPAPPYAQHAAYPFPPPEPRLNQPASSESSLSPDSPSQAIQAPPTPPYTLYEARQTPPTEEC